jgi:hypothetical protein
MTTEETVEERARRSAHISLVFERAVKRTLGGYTIEMTRPEAGARALLHIRLVADDAVTFALGWANPTDRTAELFTLGRVLLLSKRRRGRELTLPPRAYAKFLEAAQRVLEDFGMEVSIVAYTKEDEAAADSKETAPSVEVENEIETESENEGDAPRRTPTLPYLGLPSAS